MNCADFELHLSEFIDGEMSSIIRKEFLQHKNDCPDCSEILIQVKSAVNALHALPRRQVSSEFNENLRARISSTEQRSLWTWFEGFFPSTVIPKVAVTAVAASLVAIFSYTLITDTTATSRSSQQSVVPPPALNIQQSEPLRSPVIADERMQIPAGIDQQTNAHAVSETVDSNQAQPVPKRSYEGQIKYVNSEK